VNIHNYYASVRIVSVYLQVVGNSVLVTAVIQANSVLVTAVIQAVDREWSCFVNSD